MKNTALTLILSLALSAPLAAQQLAPKGDRIPPGMQPPAGMCRIWLEGVPPGQQPAPTDCPTAVRNRPPNGRVIFGDDYVKRNRTDANRDDDGERSRKDRKPKDEKKPDDDRKRP